MKGPGIDRDRERRWRRLANWLWLSPLCWWLLSGIYFGVTKDSTTVLALAILPWWILLAGILGYVAMMVHARWGNLSLMTLAGIMMIAGIGIWGSAGLYAAITCALVAPLIAGDGLLRVPPTSARRLVALLAAGLGIAESFLVLGLALSVTLLVIHITTWPLPGSGWWWLTSILCIGLLAWSAWLRRSWLQQTRAIPPVAKTDQGVANRR